MIRLIRLRRCIACPPMNTFRATEESDATGGGEKMDKVLIGAVRDAGGIPGRQFTGTTRISDGAFARYSLNPNMI